MTLLPSAEKEFAYYGLQACQALWRVRPGDVRRVFFHKDLRIDAGPWAADIESFGLKPRWVVDADLQRLTDSVHHQGVCFVAREKTAREFGSWEKSFESGARELLLYLDGVGNPHNLGAIVRTSAHFGVRAILGAKGNLPRLTPAATRTAEGGAENVDLVKFPKSQMADLLALKQKGFQFIASSIETDAVALSRFVFPLRSVLILGAEREGVSEDLLALADASVHIPGTGQVESLNVSVSAAVFMHEFFRQNGNS